MKDAGKAHEAGYDAFMTGAAFCALLRIHEAKTAAQDGPIGAQKVAEMMHESPALESVHGAYGVSSPSVSSVRRRSHIES